MIWLLTMIGIRVIGMRTLSGMPSLISPSSFLNQASSKRKKLKFYQVVTLVCFTNYRSKKWPNANWAWDKAPIMSQPGRKPQHKEGHDPRGDSLLPTTEVWEAKGTEDQGLVTGSRSGIEGGGGYVGEATRSSRWPQSHIRELHIDLDIEYAHTHNHSQQDIQLCVTLVRHKINLSLVSQLFVKLLSIKRFSHNNLVNLLLLT